MNAWWQVVLANALLAALAAILVTGITRIWRHPSLGHVLWALVLVKLITPPMVSVPISRFAEPDDFSAVSADETRLVWGEGASDGSLVAGQDFADASDNTRPALISAAQARIDWPSVLACVWGVGTAFWAGLAATRTLKFHRLVSAMPRGPKAWQDEVAALAARLDLRTWPTVRLAEGAIPPLLWTFGHEPLVVLPRALVEKLDSRGRRALLAHELAHYYRRDHWMRWLEASVLAVCWWNPVAWWACRQLRIAEEKCCDAWAVWLLDGESRLYGRTLLATIDFLCNARSTTPLGASGIGHSGSWRERFEMILEQPFGRRLSVSTWLAVVPLAILVLSVSLCFSPTGGLWWAQPSPAVSASAGGDTASVELDGKLYEVVSIDDLPAGKILETAREHHGVFWEKRFAEDIVEVMDRLGHRPGETVKLIVRDPTSGDTKTFDHAAITGEKRAKIYAAAHNDRAQAVPHALAWAKLSPFTAVHIRPGAADVAVEFAGKVYFLVSVDDLPTNEVLAGSRRYDGRRWIKRFAEDLVEVMDHMGHRPGETVKLVLRDPESGEITTIDRAPMTAENRARVYATRFADPAQEITPAVALPKQSPFTQVRVHGEAANVEFDGRLYELVSIDNLPTEEILDGSRQYWGSFWEERFVENLVEVMDRMGHPTGETVKLVLRDLQSGRTRIVERAPLTGENYAKVYAAAHGGQRND